MLVQVSMFFFFFFSENTSLSGDKKVGVGEDLKTSAAVEKWVKSSVYVLMQRGFYMKVRKSCGSHGNKRGR